MASASFPPEYHYEGFVWKMGEVNTAWQKRFACFEGDELVYYKTATRREKQGSISLMQITQIGYIEVYQGRKEVFYLQLPLRTFYLSGEDDGSTTPFWVQALFKVKYHIEKLAPSYYVTNAVSGLIPDFDQSPYPTTMLIPLLSSSSDNRLKGLGKPQRLRPSFHLAEI